MSVFERQAQDEERQALNLIAWYRLDQMELGRLAQMRQVRAERAGSCRHEFKPIEGPAGAWLRRCIFCATSPVVEMRTGMAVEQRRLL